MTKGSFSAEFSLRSAKTRCASSFCHSRSVRGVRFCDASAVASRSDDKVNCFKVGCASASLSRDDTAGATHLLRGLGDEIPRRYRWLARARRRSGAVLPRRRSRFAGGFVGVDIFFVISGYLICGMIDGRSANGAFSLRNFYKRRILRILPALFVMFLVTSMLAYVYCLPVELEEYSKSLASAVGSVSNVYFAATAGYFDAPAATKPLLHTWSLGVEEQFYLSPPC